MSWLFPLDVMRMRAMLQRVSRGTRCRCCSTSTLEASVNREGNLKSLYHPTQNKKICLPSLKYSFKKTAYHKILTYTQLSCEKCIYLSTLHVLVEHYLFIYLHVLVEHYLFIYLYVLVEHYLSIYLHVLVEHYLLSIYMY